MVAGLMNAMRGEAERVAGRHSQPRIGTISSYDPETYRVKARMMPEGTESAWMSMATAAVGAGWGLLTPPAIGDQVVVIFQEGSAEEGIVVGALHNDEDHPRVEGLGGAPAGEVWLVHKSGARIRLTNDGAMEIRRADGCKIVLSGDNMRLTASDIGAGADGATLRKVVDERFQALFNQHVHPQNGQPPVQKLDAGYLTTNFKAG